MLHKGAAQLLQLAQAWTCLLSNAWPLRVRTKVWFHLGDLTITSHPWTSMSSPVCSYLLRVGGFPWESAGNPAFTGSLSHLDTIFESKWSWSNQQALSFLCYQLTHSFDWHSTVLQMGKQYLPGRIFQRLTSGQVRLDDSTLTLLLPFGEYTAHNALSASTI